MFYLEGNVFCFELMQINYLYCLILFVFLQVQKVCDLVKVKGGKVIREFGFVKGGNLIIVFVEDSDGYLFEFI